MQQTSKTFRKRGRNRRNKSIKCETHEMIHKKELSKTKNEKITKT